LDNIKQNKLISVTTCIRSTNSTVVCTDINAHHNCSHHSHYLLGLQIKLGPHNFITSVDNYKCKKTVVL